MTLQTYSDRRRFGDAALPDAKRILSKLFLTSVANVYESSDEVDRREATDLIVASAFKPQPFKVGFRVRSARFAQTYADDITIRLSTSGGLSELQKIERGCVGYMLYGFVEGSRLTAWKLIDLAALLHALSSERPATQTFTPRNQEPFLVVSLQTLSPSARRSVVVAEG